MDMIVRQKVWSLGEHFYVQNGAGEDLFEVRGEVFSLGRKLHVLNLAGEELCLLQQKFGLTHKFALEEHGEEVAELRSKFGFGTHFVCEELGWDITGHFMSLNYEITQNGAPVAQIHHKALSLGDCYHVHVERDEDALHVLCVVLAIDSAIDDTNTAVAGSTAAAASASGAASSNS